MSRSEVTESKMYEPATSNTSNKQEKGFPFEPVISVMLPTKNEPAVQEVIKNVRNSLSKYCHEILVIDKSTDDTAERARKAGARIIFQKGTGYGDAYIQGFKHAKGNIIIMMDADMTYPPEFIIPMIKPILKDEADLVIGNRWANIKKGAMPVPNKMGNLFLTWILNKMYRMDIQDSQSGMRAITSQALKTLKLREAGMPLASEMIIDARKKRLRIAEVPITYEVRAGVPKQRISHGLGILGTTLRLLRDYNPLLMFGTLSLILAIGGITIGLTPLTYFLKHNTLVMPGRAILSSTLIIGAFFFFGFALMFDLLVKELKNH